MKTRSVIIDTDPGIDDAAALAIALFSEELDIKLITTVAGNVSLDKVTNNALKLLHFFGKTIPLAKGAAEPLICPFSDASDIHGQSGLEGWDFELPPEKQQLVMDKHAIEAMKRVIMHSPEPITLLPIGPLTNIALLLKVYPEIKPHIEEIVLMGGSLTRGNKSVMAEFNIATDPEAAKIVFSSGIPLVMIGLDIGWQAVIRLEESEQLKNLNKTGAMLYSLFRQYRGGCMDTGLSMYDSCAVAYLLRPDMFKTAAVYADVELHGSLTAGCTVVDLAGCMNRIPNTRVCTEVDAAQFRSWFLESIKRCP